MKNFDKLRILMIAPACYPPVGPEAMVNAKLALTMKKAGWHVDIITEGRSKKYGRYPADEAAWKELVNDVHFITRGHRKTLARRLLNGVQGFLLTGRILRRLGLSLSALDVAKKLASKSKYDAIISRANPYYAHMAGLLVHKQTGIPWIANWNDPMPYHKYPPPYGKGPASPLTPHFRKLHQAICTHCSWHTFPSDRLREYMCSYLPRQVMTKSSVIPHVVMEKFSIATVSDDGFSVCYAGSVLPPREVTVLLEGAKRFRKLVGNSDSFSIRFIVDEPDIVTDSAKTMGVEDIIRIEAQRPYSQMPRALARSNVLVIIEAPVEEGIFLPGKLVDYVQIGRPILALSPVVGKIADILSKHGGGIAVDCKSPDAVAQAFQTLYAHWKEGTLNLTYGSASLVRLFSEERVLRLYMDLFEEIFSKIR
jgi:glycosyltransferase involved in cell wall biosynthesis